MPPAARFATSALKSGPAAELGVAERASRPRWRDRVAELLGLVDQVDAGVVVEVDRAGLAVELTRGMSSPRTTVARMSADDAPTIRSTVLDSTTQRLFVPVAEVGHRDGQADGLGLARAGTRWNAQLLVGQDVARPGCWWV